nr:unnamed protein product [Callosobruchus chinensis]
MKNLLKKNEQHEAAIKKLAGKHDRETAVLKRQNQATADRDRLKQLERECAQVKYENATLKHMVAQLEAESASKNKNDSAIAKTKKARIKEDQSNVREKLEFGAENKKLKSDLCNVLAGAKKSLENLFRAKDVDNKMEQRLANLENKNSRLKKELEKALTR